MELSFRAAQPSDVAAAVPLIYASGPHEFDYVFGAGAGGALDYLAFAFRSGRGLSSYHIATVAVAGGSVAGIYVCHTLRDHPAIERGNLANILRFYGLRRGLGVLRRALRIGTVLPPPDRGTDYISQVGVADSLRGRGIGTALLQRQRGLARDRGLQRCALDVATTNRGAQRLYERLGFRVVAERAWKYADGHVPGQRRMELAV